MKIFFYSKSTDEKKTQIIHGIQMLVRQRNLETFDSLAELIQRQKIPVLDSISYIFFDVNRDDLDEILNSRLSLNQSFVIIVLDGNDSETLAAAHRLRPRYITYVDSDISGIMSVLEKKLGQPSHDGHWD